jgi:predicted metal-dependent hydrolase
LWHDRELRDWKSAKNYLKTTLINPALLLKIVVAGLAYLRRDFHTWQHDSRHIINIWRQEFARTQDPLAATEKLWTWQMQQKYTV